MGLRNNSQELYESWPYKEVQRTQPLRTKQWPVPDASLQGWKLVTNR
jgi:hypothetical protein